MSFIVENLEVAAGTFRVGIDRLEIPRGNIHGLMGPSGSGKSTLLLGIAGFLPSTGNVSLDGKSLSDLPPERRRIALGFQRASLFPRLTALENVAFGLKMQGVSQPEREMRARDWLVRCRVGDLAERLPHQVSEGQAQRIALARSLAPGFPVLLLDEPFSALDDATRAELRDLLRSCVREAGISALFVSHHSDDKILCDSIMYLK